MARWPRNDILHNSPIHTKNEKKRLTVARRMKPMPHTSGPQPTKRETPRVNWNVYCRAKVITRV